MKTNIIRTLLIAMFISFLGVFTPNSDTFAQQKDGKVPKITSDTMKHPKFNKHKKRKHHRKHWRRHHWRKNH